MTENNSREKAKNNAALGKCRLTLRFADEEHLEMIRAAAKNAKVTMNAWLIRATMEAAQRELRLK